MIYQHGLGVVIYGLFLTENSVKPNYSINALAAAAASDKVTAFKAAAYNKCNFFASFELWVMH